MTTNRVPQPPSRTGIHGGRVGFDEDDQSPEELLRTLKAYNARDAAIDAAAARKLLEAAVAGVKPLADAPRQNPTTAERVALHEAAHAIVGRAMHAAGQGAPVEYVAVESTRTGVTVSALGYTSPLSAVTRLLAGAMAERLAFGASMGSDSDYEQAAAWVAGRPSPARIVSAAASRCEWLLRSEWGALEYVAAGLRRARVLQRRHVDTLAETAPLAPRLDGLDHRELARLFVASGNGEGALAHLRDLERRLDRSSWRELLR